MVLLRFIRFKVHSFDLVAITQHLIFILATLLMTYLLFSCESAVEVDKSKSISREKLNYVNLNVRAGYIHPDTLTTIVLRNKEDENQFFETYEAKSYYPFPEVDYDINDVIGISLGPRPNIDTYVEIDSLILVDEKKIEVYSTEHWLYSLSAAVGFPLDMITIAKYNVEIEFMERELRIE